MLHSKKYYIFIYNTLMLNAIRYVYLKSRIELIIISDRLSLFNILITVFRIFDFNLVVVYRIYANI